MQKIAAKYEQLMSINKINVEKVENWPTYHNGLQNKNYCQLTIS